MSTDDNPKRYILQWHPLPQPPWGKSKEEARQLAIDALWRENIMSRGEAAAFVDAHGEVVEVVE